MISGDHLPRLQTMYQDQSETFIVRADGVSLKDSVMFKPRGSKVYKLAVGADEVKMFELED